ncbi:hypothetical protein LJC17_04615 [Acholeplasma sp. OttesenSCG-928-E16]|nr:hypothetical protein [Acholeplasma sp. OttesenSCG-928-E16]
MKCRGCGANINSKDSKCEYCGLDNNSTSLKNKPIIHEYEVVEKKSLEYKKANAYAITIGIYSICLALVSFIISNMLGIAATLMGLFFLIIGIVILGQSSKKNGQEFQTVKASFVIYSFLVFIAIFSFRSFRILGISLYVLASIAPFVLGILYFVSYNKAKKTDNKLR